MLLVLEDIASYADVVRNGIAHDPMMSSRKELVKNGTAAASLTKLNFEDIWIQLEEIQIKEAGNNATFPEAFIVVCKLTS